MNSAHGDAADIKLELSHRLYDGFHKACIGLLCLHSHQGRLLGLRMSLTLLDRVLKMLP